MRPVVRRKLHLEAVLCWVIVMLGASPLLLAWPVPLQDWPNHVAGAHVLAALLDGDVFWSGYYRFNTFMVPNAAVDLGLLGLRRAGLSEPAAANLFLLVTYAVFVGGMAALSRMLSRLDALHLAAAVLLFYGAALFWGLVNCVLAIGLLWILLASWLAVGLRAPGWRVAIAAFGAALLLFVHVVPAMVFALLLGCFDAVRLRSGARLSSCASTPMALLVAVCGLRALPGDTGRDLAIVYAWGPSLTGFAAWKLRVFATSPFGGSALLDGATMLALLGGGLAVALAARMRMPPGALFAVLALIALTLAAPERIGTGSLLDVRLAVLPAMLAAASCRLQWRSIAARRACLAVVMVLVLGRTAVIAQQWRAASQVFTAFDAGAAAVPRGSIMMMGYGRPIGTLSWTDIWSPAIQSMAAQVVTRGVCFPALFANPDQQPIALRQPLPDLGQPWDMSDPVRSRASLTAIGLLCESRAYAGVFLTVLYGDAPFRILDACAPPS